MSDIQDTISEKAGEFKEQASSIGQGLKEKAGEVIDKIKSGDIQEELGKLKDEASEKIGDLADEAKGLWGKLTGSGEGK